MEKKLILFISIFLLFACNSELEEQYHQNGSLKLVVPLKNGIRDGEMKEYGEAGNLIAKSEWKNNLMDGLALHYYEDGSLKESTIWLKGERHGQVKGYHTNGNERFSGEYENGKALGSHIFYYPSGGIMEKQLYDEKGNLETYFKYDDGGNPRLDASRPIYSHNEDTITIGQKITIGVRLGNPVSEDVRAYIGLPHKDLNKLGLKDTIETLYSDTYWKYQYSFQPEKVGLDSLKGVLINVLETDSQTYFLQHVFTFQYFVTEN